MENIETEIENMTGVKLNTLVEHGLVNRRQATKWIVKQKYYEMAKTGRTYTDIKNELSDNYDISVSAIEKLIYRKRYNGV